MVVYKRRKDFIYNAYYEKKCNVEVSVGGGCQIIRNDD